jgi:succinate dehydrogenase / fumarate reductase cytochrome b subunit
MEDPKRPLSPFLIYRWGVTNTLSIVHRLTGVYLTLGLFVLACWLLALASGPEPYADVAAFLFAVAATLVYVAIGLF